MHTPIGMSGSGPFIITMGQGIPATRRLTHVQGVGGLPPSHLSFGLRPVGDRPQACQACTAPHLLRCGVLAPLALKVVRWVLAALT